MPNFAIRYPEGEDDEEFNAENNYSAWIPRTSLMLWDIRTGGHQYIPRDYA